MKHLNKTTVFLILSSAGILTLLGLAMNLYPNITLASTLQSLEEIHKKNKAMEAEMAARRVSPCNAVPVERTGQAKSYKTGDDGSLQKGTAWPRPRFTDNRDGTIKDNLTGLVWFKDADALGSRSWPDALTQVALLNKGTNFSATGYKAGSHKDWRLPNINELISLVHRGVFKPAVPDTEGTGQWRENDPFVDVQAGYYWSGTTNAASTPKAWHVDMSYGHVYSNGKKARSYVWPVRGGDKKTETEKK